MDASFTGWRDKEMEVVIIDLILASINIAAYKYLGKRCTICLLRDGVLLWH